ncbi:MAG: hypothetical protein KAH25_09760, partial [Bacteroidales bacterium]|nr:hypothetical protein [Bacteroidales bacterium]
PNTNPPSPSEIYISSDSGITWTKLSINKDLLGGQGWYDNAIISDPYDKKNFYVAGVNIYKVRVGYGNTTRVTTLTDNYGSDPSLHKGTHVDNHFFAIAKLDDDNKIFRLVGTNDGGVCFTDDEGITFSQPTSGFITSQFYGVDKANGKARFIGGMQDNSCYASPLNPSSDDNWQFAFGGDGFDVVWNYEDEDKIMLSSQYNYIGVTHKGIDNFNTTYWLANIDKGNGDNAPFFTKIAQSKYYSDLVFTFGKSGVWRTENFGTNWEKINMPLSFNGLSSTTEIKISLAAPEVVWTGRSLTSSNPMFVSTDFGKSFNIVSLSNLASRSVSGFATHPTNKNTAYALFSSYGNSKILRTTDLGNSWIDISGFDGNGGVSSNGFPDVAIFDLLVLPYGDYKTIWVGTEIGLFESTDGGANWHFANNNLPPVSIYDLLVVNDKVVIGTHGRGVWTVSLPELAGYEPPVADAPVKLDASYSFDGSSQNAVINLKYRSNYQSVKVFINENLINKFTNVSAGGFENINADIVVGDNIIKVVSVVGSKTFETNTTITGLPLKPASEQFVSNFDDMSSINDDFYGSGYSLSKPSGFDSKAINTNHPYLANKDLYLYLRTPIIVKNDYPDFTYSDVAIVEPGEPGTKYPHEEFWDYVTVQMSSDGVNWINTVTPYDARFNEDWLIKYNSSTNPSKTDYKQH